VTVIPEAVVDDPELAARLRAGDETAFAGVIHAYGSALHRVARCYVPNKAVADEAVQDTWLAVIDGIDRFAARSSVKTWIFGILRNIARRHGRRERRSIAYGSSTDPRDTRGEHFEPDRFLQSGHSHVPGHWRSFSPAWECRPDDELARRETMGAVAAAIDALCPSQREVITLRDVEGWSAAEVCETLSLTPVHQRVLLHRARVRVRAALEHDVVGEV
jgi:RNA polymerase sigma-70 factor (ECF subfamily)